MRESDSLAWALRQERPQPLRHILITATSGQWQANVNSPEIGSSGYRIGYGPDPISALLNALEIGHETKPNDGNPFHHLSNAIDRLIINIGNLR